MILEFFKQEFCAHKYPTTSIDDWIDDKRLACPFVCIKCNYQLSWD